VPETTAKTLGESPLPWQSDNWDRFCSHVQQQRLAHASLLFGEQGLGKRTFAFAAARLLLCDQPSDSSPCGSCPNCRFSANDNHPDLLRVAPEDGSKILKVDQVRALGAFTDKTAHSAGRKVVIIEQSDSLNINAANALLKTLEEPAGDTVLLLLSDKPGSLMPTIRSRCQRVSFVTPKTDVALAWLNAKLEDRSEIASLLDLAGGKPVLAQELADSGELEQRQNIVRAFARISEGKLDPIEFAATFKSLNVETVMDYLWHTTSVLIKYLLCKDEAMLASSEIRTIVNKLRQNKRQENASLSRLLQLNQAAEEAKRQLASSSNPNQQLIFEGMMWRWARITG
jgi:DNA polymerase-3 subunit delta'